MTIFGHEPVKYEEYDLAHARALVYEYDSHERRTILSPCSAVTLE